jgi:NADPH-dependent glutamate synthase beta subunit-like oxidoreductase
MMSEASACLQDFLPFPAITGLLCHHPCEKACARKRVDQAVNIHGLEYYFGKEIFPKRISAKPSLDAEKIAVIGSGPTGLSAAYFLSMRGYTVTIFESGAEFGGSFLKEVRSGCLPMDILDACFTNLKGMGISFVQNQKLTRDVSIKGLRDQQFRAILLATGQKGHLPDEIARDQKGAVKVDPMTLQTNSVGVFAGGGILAEKLSLVEIIARSRKIAISMDLFLRNEDPSAAKNSNIKKVKRLPRDDIEKQPRFDSDQGFDGLSAVREAGRCMSCGALACIAYPEDCMTCFDCEVNCPSKAVTVHPFKEVMPMTLALT